MFNTKNNPEILKICEGTRPNECITIFSPNDQKFIFGFDHETVLECTLDELNKSKFTRPFEMLKGIDDLIPKSDIEQIGILHIAIYSAFFEYKEFFRSLKDYLYCSFRMKNREGHFFRIEKETHSYFESSTNELLLVDMWRRVDFKSSNQKIEWGPIVDSHKKNDIIATIKTHIYRNLGVQPLSKREEEIVQLIDTGKSLKSIGETLFIERNTVKKHLENIKKKLSNKFSKEDLSTKDQISNALRLYGIIGI